MCSSSTLPQTKPEKRVRFHESINIVEIERFDVDTMDEEIRYSEPSHHSSYSDHSDDERKDADSSTSSMDSLFALRDVFSSCSSLSSRSPSSIGPITRPTKIPSFLFNTLSVNSEYQRWRGTEDNNSDAATCLTAPVRAPSIDQILGTALDILNDSSHGVFPAAQQQRREQQPLYSEELSSQRNHSWEKNESRIATNQKRWNAISQSPPKAPRRRTSIEIRRSSWPGATARATRVLPM